MKIGFAGAGAVGCYYAGKLFVSCKVTGLPALMNAIQGCLSPDAINGYIAAQAVTVGLGAPINRMLTTLMHATERSASGGILD